MVFDLEGDHTLLREESRAASLRSARDFCKLHIIAHYPAVLLPPPFKVHAIGAVGLDDAGRELKGLMRQDGMELALVRDLPDAPTMFSACFQYPDGTGGNITASNSASARLTAADVDRAKPVFAAHAGRGIALAAPEVPLAARARLLDLAGVHGFFRAASFTAGEIRAAATAGLFDHLDLVAINVDEARALVGLATDSSMRGVLPAAIQAIRKNRPGCQIVVTDGVRGAWGLEPVGDGVRTHHAPARAADLKGSAGAGDAFLAGLLIGLAAGLDFAARLEFAALLASAKVTSADTIHFGLDRAALAAHAAATGDVSPAVARLL